MGNIATSCYVGDDGTRSNSSDQWVAYGTLTLRTADAEFDFIEQVAAGEVYEYAV
jgi:hypothetical protein